MSRNILCAVYLLIAISTVHSASYYVRIGREVIVPTIEEVKEVIPELKKEEPIAIEEIVSIQATPEIVDPAAAVAAEAPQLPVELAAVAKSVPSVVESVVPIVENVENNVVVAAVEEPKQVIAAEVIDEARAQPIPNTLLRLETIEVVQPGVTPEKVATVAETVKIAAVQAIEKQNEELVKPVEIAKPVEPSTETKEIETPAVKSVPIVESVEASVKTAEPVAVPIAVVQPAEVVVPAAVEKVEIVEKVEPAQESVRSAVADPEPVKTEIVKEEKIEVPAPVSSEVEKVEEKIVEKSAEVPTVPEIRQQAAQPGPLDAITTAITNLQNTVQTTFQNAIQNTPIISNIFRPQAQSDAPNVAGVEAPAVALNTAEVAPTVASNVALPATPLAGSSTVPPNFLQNVQNAISSLATNILRPTTAPAAAAAAAPAVPEVASPVIVSGTRGGDDSVEVVQHIDVDVNDKIDLAKQTTQ